MKKKIAALTLAAIGMRMLMLSGFGDAAENWLRELAADGRLLSVSLNFELGGALPDNLSEIDEKPEPIDEAVESPASAAAEYIQIPEESQSPVFEPEDMPEIVPTTIEGGLVISNDTSYEPDVEALMSSPINIKLPADGPQILIIHTHGSEAYTPDALDMYTPSDPGRTEDKRYNVIRVGDELTSALEAYGLNVIHDRELYDYPSYTGSYPRSEAAIISYLEQYPDIGIVIDLHRDALGSNDVIYKTVAENGGVSSSQLMMLVGTGENGLYHPNWQENLKLALKLQSAIIGKHPTLARPVALKQERYNQHLTTGSLILEVGSTGNTLNEALCAIRLYADSIGDLLVSLIDKG